MKGDLKKLADQAAGMMLTDHTETEVREWLERKKRIVGTDADQIVEFASSKRRGEVRTRALLRVIFSGIGMLLFVVFLFLQYAGNFIMVGIPVFICWGLGIISFPVFVRSLVETINGNTNRPLQ